MRHTPQNSKRSAYLIPSLVCVVALTASLFGCGGGGESKGRIVGTAYDGEPGQTTRIASGMDITVAHFDSSGTVVPNYGIVATTMTDNNGRFAVSVPPGNYNVWAENGLQFYNGIGSSCILIKNVDVNAGRDSTADLGSHPCDGAFP